MHALVTDKLDMHAFTIDALLIIAVESQLFPVTSKQYGVLGST
jgi:hypothetical protein